MSATVTFLGTGNFVAPGQRYWNSFVLRSAELTILVEPSPTALPNLRRAGIGVEQLDAIVISHFHPDHTFGWPFLLFEATEIGRGRPLTVLGPPGVRAFLGEMMHLGSLEDADERAHRVLDISYLEAGDGIPLEVAGARVTPSLVEHAPSLCCFGYVIEVEGRRLGYSGDSRPCAGLDTVAGSCEMLVVECNGAHPSPMHMDVEAVKSLASRFPGTRLVVTHLGEDVDPSVLAGIHVPDDYDRVEVAAPQGPGSPIGRGA